MSSISETGHAKNVGNLAILISFCNGYGSVYNPSNVELTIAKLDVLLTLAKDCLLETKRAKASFDNATNARQIAFKALKPLGTKIVNAFASSGAGASGIADATGINRKIQGGRASGRTKATNQEVTARRTISTSQQSYDSLIDHFTKLLETVSQDAHYNPNEPELKLTTLQATLANLMILNTGVTDALTNLSNRRIRRDDVLYSPIWGVIKRASEVKKYVKSIFGAVSPQFQQLSSLKFKNINVL
ncbi:hypothetical protein [Polluticaenibacter yanchengensis]|uniref:Uncharacterized protein n=1 Tax=Polluticaenibacter yanchengensis TaxID=3014562 RepID=A0ABT4UGW0_9BACT|nr:hypothetical protein [Chitinophagaceae bacterium LY-5]